MSKIAKILALSKVIGGGGGGGGGEITTQSLSVNSNGTYTAPTGKAYTPVTVSVPNTYAAGDEGKVVSSGALVSQTSTTASSNGTIDTTLHNSVAISVPNTYAAGDEGKVVSSGALVSQTSRNVTANGTIDTTLNNQVVVNVSGGGTTPSGVKYIYSDVDGEGAWGHTLFDGYEYLSYDYAPVKDNKFRFWIEVDSNDLTFTPPISVSSSAVYRYTGAIDWGDGTTPTEFAYGNTDHTHTYASPGRYCVEIWRTGGAEYFSIGNQSSDAVRAKIIAVEFYFIGYPTNTLKTLYNVRKLRYSSQQTTISLTDYNSLTDVILPDSATTLNGCYRMYALQKLVIPASVTTIAAGCFTNCTAMKEYHFLPTTPPTLGDANVFKYIPSDCVIYVPQGSLTAYQTATNWSTYASYIQEEPS